MLYKKLGQSAKSLGTRVSDRNGGEASATVLRDALRACRRHIGYVALFSAALNLLYLAPSIYMLQVYDRVLASGGLLTLVYISVVLLAALGVLAFLDTVRVRLLLAMSKRFDRIAAPHVLMAALQREGRQAAGQAQIVREFDTLRGAMSGQPALAAIDAPWAPVYIAVCFLIHPWLGMLTLLGGATLVGLAFLNQRMTHKAMRASEQSAGAMYQLQQSDAAQGETARALGMQGVLVERQLAARAAMLEGVNDAGRMGATYTASTKFVRLILQSAALGLGAFLALQQEISAGGIIAASILAARAFAPLELIVGAWRQIEQGFQAYGVLNRVLKTQEIEREFTALPAPRGVVALENVCVKAPGSDRFLLIGANLRAEPGDIIGIVGPSGAGKTTLVRMIAGAAAPDVGAVRIDGAKLTDWQPDKLGPFIGYLPQDVALFAGTIGENISRFDKADRDQVHAKIVDAARAAGVHELILTLPQGYDTEIGRNGRGLSAGQAQRIGLARALYGDPVLLALDEPNAHLDSDGENALVNALRAASARGACTFVVAHRAGFMSIANKLLFMRDGRVEMYGPRDQVMAKMNPGPRPVAAPGEASEARS